MPRTKRPTKRQEKPSRGEHDNTVESLNRIVADQKEKIDRLAELEITNLELAFKMFLSSVNKSYLHMTVGQLKSELLLKEPTNTNSSDTCISRSASHDDGYLTENSSQDSTERGKKKQFLAPPPRSTSRRSRSADTSRKQAGVGAGHSSLSKPLASRRRSRSVYQTPALRRNGTNNFPPITPKVAPNTPLAVLRQPRQGEMVVSMSGSPVMVPSCYTMQHERANCNIMLNDGTLLSLQPNQLRVSQTHIPFSLMNAGVLDQLKTLKDNLEKVVSLGEKAIK